MLITSKTATIMRYAGKIKNLTRALLPGGRKQVFKWLYKSLSSVTYSVYLMWLLVLLFIIGTIFPQGENLDEYIKAGGGYLNLVISFDLLDLFSSPGFVVLSVILLINLIVCVFDRYKALFAPRRFPASFMPDKSISISGTLSRAHSSVRGVFKDQMGFKLASKDSEWIVMEKNLLSPRFLTWLYHAALVICLIGALTTYLFAFEDSLTLYPGQAKPIKTKSIGRVQSFWEKEHTEDGWSVQLDEFSPEYFQTPKLDYPKDKKTRLAVGLGWKDTAYSVKDDALTPKAWKSKIKIIKSGRTAAEKIIDVNDPLKYGGYTFYQEGYEQKVKLQLYNNPMAIEAKTDEEVYIPGIENPVKFAPVKTGTLYKIDGTNEKITPSSRVTQKAKPSDSNAQTVTLGSSIIIDNVKVTFADIDTGAIVTYRYDPGFTILWWGGMLAVAAMCLRFYCSFYTAAYNVTEANGMIYINVFVRAKGLGANKERMLERLEKNLCNITAPAASCRGRQWT